MKTAAFVYLATAAALAGFGTNAFAHDRITAGTAVLTGEATPSGITRVSVLEEPAVGVMDSIDVTAAALPENTPVTMTGVVAEKVSGNTLIIDGPNGSAKARIIQPADWTMSFVGLTGERIPMGHEVTVFGRLHKDGSDMPKISTDAVYDRDTGTVYFGDLGDQLNASPFHGGLRDSETANRFRMTYRML